MRNLLCIGLLAFAAIEKGGVGVSGSTGAMLRRCLQDDLSAVVNRSMAEARMELELQKHERVRVAELIEEVGIAAAFQADAHGHQFVVDPLEFDIVVDAESTWRTSVGGWSAVMVKDCSAHTSSVAPTGRAWGSACRSVTAGSRRMAARFVRDLRGTGCVFTMYLPRLPPLAA